MGKRAENPRCCILSARFTPQEAAELAREAKIRKMALSEVIRERVLEGGDDLGAAGD